jgi:hypothetical protein
MERSKFLAGIIRSDKFQLSGGRLMFAPRYPCWLESPGWWDELYWHDEELQPVFGWTILESGRETHLSFQSRKWQPGHCSKVFIHNSHLNVTENQFITPDDRVVSSLSIDTSAGGTRSIDLIVWTRHHYHRDLSRPRGIEASRKGISFLLDRDGRRAPFTTCWEFAADRTADSFAVVDTECLGPNPRWCETPFAVAWTGTLPSEIWLNEKSERGAVWFALHYRLSLDKSGDDQMPKHEIEKHACNIAVGMRIVHPYKSIVAVKHGSGKEMLSRTLEAWTAFFDGVPEFSCSEPLWENLYRYRWYLIRQCLKAGGEERQPYDGFCEGPTIFHQPISYSTPPIVFDLRWHRDPSWARNQILNFCERQEDEGRLPGALFHDRSRAEFFYHADWGRALLRLHESHPDRSFLKRIYQPMNKYAQWLAAARDGEKSGMIDVLNMMETGQEFSSRYIPAGELYDDDFWLETVPIKGVDSTVYYYLHLKALTQIASELDRKDESEKWRRLANFTREAILKQMWQSEGNLFSDLVASEGMRPTRVRSLTCFYPFLTDMVGAEHVRTLGETLLNPEEFWTPFPAATLSRRDPAFSEDGVWRGKMRNCPWNGRVWPMTNSHMVEVLAEASKFNPALHAKCSELLTSFARLFNAGGGPGIISSYEHYSPRDGSPCTYRGIDDYLHCWMIDLIIRYVAGFRLENGILLVDPIIEGLESIELSGLPLAGKLFDVTIRGGMAEVFSDGRRISSGRIPLQVVFSS